MKKTYNVRVTIDLGKGYELDEPRLWEELATDVAECLNEPEVVNAVNEKLTERGPGKTDDGSRWHYTDLEFQLGPEFSTPMRP